MNLTYELIKTEISKLDKILCKEVGATEEGQKFSLLMLKKLSGHKRSKLMKYYSDGGGDHQIDGIYFFEDGDELKINILCCEFRSNGKPIADKDVFDLISNGLNYLLYGEVNVNDLNDKIKSIKLELDELRIDYEEKFLIEVKFISTSENVLSPNGESAFLKYQSEKGAESVSYWIEKIRALGNYNYKIIIK